MRARVLLILAILLASGARADADDAGYEAEVALAHALGDELRVTLRASRPVEVALPDGREATIAPGEDLSYRVALARPSATIAIATRVSVLPRGSPEPTLVAPDGWGARASEGAIVFAQDLHERAREIAGARVREVANGPLAPEDRYLAPAVAYLRAQHPAADAEILLVRAPREVAGEGWTANGTLVVARDAPPAVVAQLLARLHQGYRVVEVAPASAAWFREGEARLHAEMALVAGGARTAEEVDAAFATARAVADPDDLLTQAPAGSTLARQKGLVVVRALDAEIRTATGQGAGLADLLERLDATHARLDSAEIERQATDLAGPAIGAFFERYVYGPAWPATPGVRDGPDVFVLALRVDPARAMPGELTVAHYVAVNRGTRAADEGFPLTVDGAPHLSVTIRAPVGARANGTVPLSLDTPGAHTIGLGAARAPFHVLAPGRLTLAQVSATPSEPRAGEAFTLLVYVQNVGEGPAHARVEVYEGERLVQRTTDALIEGNSTDALTLPLRLDEAGLHVLDVRLVSDEGSGRIEHPIEVRLVEGDRRESPLSWTSAPFAALLAVLLGATRAARGRRPR